MSDADIPTIWLGATPSGLISDPPPSPSIFMPNSLAATTLPIYPGLGQAPNMLACIPSGLAWLRLNFTDYKFLLRVSTSSSRQHSVICGCEILVGTRWERTLNICFQQPRHHSWLADWNRYP